MPGIFIGNSVINSKGSSWNQYWTKRGVSTLAARTLSDTTIALTWANTGLTDYTGHKVFVSTDNVSFVLNKTITSIGTSTTLTGLTANTKYYIKIYAYKGSGLSTASNTVIEVTWASEMLDAAKVARYDFTDLATITNDTDDIRTNKVVDVLGGAVEVVQATDNKKPYSTRNGMVFNEAPYNQDLKSAAFTYNQPESIYLVFKQTAWDNAAHITDGNANFSGGLRQDTASPQLEAYAGAGSANVSLALNTWGIVRIVFNGANSSIQLNAETAQTGNFGAANMGGITLGSAGGATFRRGKCVIADAIFRSGADSAPTSAAIYSYLTKKHADKLNAPTAVWERKGIVLSGTEDYEQTWCQEPTVMYTETDSIIVGNPCLQMFYSSGIDSGVYGTSYAESKDGITWVKHPNNPISPLMRNFAFKHNGVYYLYGRATTTECHTSTDIINWTQRATDIIPPTDTYSGSANRHVWVEGDTWYMIFDYMHKATGIYHFGLATSPDGFTWTPYANNPILKHATGSVGGPYVHKASNGRYYLWSHNAITGVVPTEGVLYSSTDLINWVMENNDEMRRITADEGAGSIVGQIADLNIVEFNGKAYCYYVGNADCTAPPGAIKLAIGNLSIDGMAMASIKGVIAES